MLLCNRSRYKLLVVQLLNHLCFVHLCSQLLYVILHGRNRSTVCLLFFCKLFILLLSDLLSLFNYNLILNFYQNYRSASSLIKTISSFNHSTIWVNIINIHNSHLHRCKSNHLNYSYIDLVRYTQSRSNTLQIDYPLFVPGDLRYFNQERTVSLAHAHWCIRLWNRSEPIPNKG